MGPNFYDKENRKNKPQKFLEKLLVIEATLTNSGNLFVVFYSTDLLTTKFQWNSRSTGKLTAFPVVFEGNERKLQNCRVFLRNTRDSANHDLK